MTEVDLSRLRSGSVGVTLADVENDAPHTIGSIEAQLRSEAGRSYAQHMRNTNPTAVGLPQPRVYRVWETSRDGVECIVDVRERLPDGTSQSIAQRNRGA